MGGTAAVPFLWLQVPLLGSWQPYPQEQLIILARLKKELIKRTAAPSETKQASRPKRILREEWSEGASKGKTTLQKGRLENNVLVQCILGCKTFLQGELMIQALWSKTNTAGKRITQLDYLSLFKMLGCTWGLLGVSALAYVVCSEGERGNVWFRPLAVKDLGEQKSPWVEQEDHRRTRFQKKSVSLQPIHWLLKH